LRYFLSQLIPPFDRTLLVESGSRHLIEDLLPGIYSSHPHAEVDLVTCYAGLPKTFRPERGRVWRVTDYPAGAARSSFYRELAARRHTVCGIVCAGEPIMTKWKWMLALRSRGKLFILNENGDYFWADRSEWRTMRHFALFRAGLAGAGAVRTLARLVMFPFTLSYLLLYAATVHLRRKFL
jgi:hypothetical protein